MNSYQVGTVGSTLGASALFFASQLGLAATAHDFQVEQYLGRVVVVSPEQTGLSSANTTWSISSEELSSSVHSSVSEAEFHVIAMQLAQVQEPLGSDLERVLSLRFEDLLD